MTRIAEDRRRVSGDAQRAGWRAWTALVALLLPVALTSIDTTVLTFALPQVSVALRPTGAQLLWLVDIYPLMLAGFLVAMGSLGDRLGRRRVLLVGAAGFGIASVLAAYSGSPETLLASRALLGIFGATLMPLTLSLLRSIFTDPRDRRLAVAAWSAMFAGGAGLGPIVGGYLLEHFWWGSVFLINVPIIVVFGVLAVLVVPESRADDAARIDLPSMGLSLLTTMPFVLAIKHAAEYGADDLTVGSVALGLLAGTLFVRRQRRLADPLVDLSLFADPVFSGAVAAHLLSMTGYAGFLFFAAQLLQVVEGLSPMASATVLLPGLALTIVGGFAVVGLVRLVPARAVISASFGLCAAGYAMVAFVGDPSAGALIVAFAVLGAGIGMAETLTNDLVLATVPPRKAGAASAISETAYEIGAVLGTAVLGSILTVTYRQNLRVPTGAELAETDTETVGGTVEAAGGLGERAGEQLVASAHAAFELGVERASTAAIVVALTAAVLIWTMTPNAAQSERH